MRRVATDSDHTKLKALAATGYWITCSRCQSHLMDVCMKDINSDTVLFTQCVACTSVMLPLSTVVEYGFADDKAN